MHSGQIKEKLVKRFLPHPQPILETLPLSIVMVEFSFWVNKGEDGNPVVECKKATNNGSNVKEQ